jgi:hypothetical protein
MWLIAKGQLATVMLHMEPKKTFPSIIKCQGKSLMHMSSNMYCLERGRYLIEEIPNPWGKSADNCYKLIGVPIAASKNNLFHYAGPAWGASEVVIFDKGKQIAGRKGIATLEREATELANDPNPLRKRMYEMLSVKRQHLGILAELRRELRATDLRKVIRFKMLWCVIQESSASQRYHYRLDLHHDDRRIAGVRIVNNSLFVEHHDLVNATSFSKYLNDPPVRSFDLADPECFKHAENYLREAWIMGIPATAKHPLNWNKSKKRMKKLKEQ